MDTVTARLMVGLIGGTHLVRKFPVAVAEYIGERIILEQGCIFVDIGKIFTSSKIIPELDGILASRFVFHQFKNDNCP